MAVYNRFEVLTSDEKLSTMIDVRIDQDILAMARENLKHWNIYTEQSIEVVSIRWLSQLSY